MILLAGSVGSMHEIELPLVLQVCLSLQCQPCVCVVGVASPSHDHPVHAMLLCMETGVL